jgi:hypothetical protein
MSKKTLMAATVIVFVVLVIIAFGYYFANQSQVVPSPIPSQTNFYLPDSRIFVVSANASYGSYPFPTVTNQPYSSPVVIARQGEPCVIINLTLRNDYSAQTPAVNHWTNSSPTVYVSLTAKVFNGNNSISSKDITNALGIASAATNSAFTSFDYGENTTVTIYLATNSKDVTSFQLVPRYIGELQPP